MDAKRKKRAGSPPVVETKESETVTRAADRPSKPEPTKKSLIRFFLMYDKSLCRGPQAETANKQCRLSANVERQRSMLA